MLYFPVVLFITVCKVVLTSSFEFVDEILKCDHLIDGHSAVLLAGSVCFPTLSNENFSLFSVVKHEYISACMLLSRSPEEDTSLFAVYLITLVFVNKRTRENLPWEKSAMV